MSDARAARILAAADELQQRDDAVAAEIAELDELVSAAAAVRSRAIEVRDALSAVPAEAASVERSVEEARARESESRIELADAESRLAGLEAARRRKHDEIEQAGRQVATVRDSLADARHRVERLQDRRLQLRDAERSLHAQAGALIREAGAVAGRIRGARRVMDAGKGEPGGSLEAIDEWGGRVGAALFVARGTAENERERIVHEASALLASVLGEAPPGSSVALARRRLEEALAG